MKITANSVVFLTYELRVDGSIVDTATEEKPLDYIQGMHMLIPRFEAEVEGLEPGAEFSFSVPPEEGYGLYESKYRFDIPKSSFEVNGQLREDLLVVGRTIPMLNSAGEVCNATVIEIKESEVTVDFNHPMAGKVLNFTGKVISVREATEKELREGLHGEFLPMECGCGCGHHHGEGEGCGCGHHHGEGEDCGCGHHHGEGEGCCHHHEGEGCCHHGEN